MTAHRRVWLWILILAISMCIYQCAPKALKGTNPPPVPEAVSEEVAPDILPPEGEEEKKQSPEGDPETIIVQNTSRDYIIGAEDLIGISVYELPEMNKTVRISGEGSITLPFIGEIKAEGLTQQELEKIIRILLSERYITNPQVTVFIKEYRSKRASIIGAVENPGSYPLIGNRTILDIISEAGGITEKAGKKLYLIRGSSSESSTESILIDLEELIEKGNPELNLPIQGGDVISIPPEKFIYIYVFGAVNSPGQIEVKESESITVLQAITKAGGLTDRAAKTRVKIIRQDESGKEQIIKVDLKDIINGKKKDIILQKDDIVIVPETFF
ncbi:MAG: polysaccharide export protein [Candidatus Aminicenantes bacterium]|nr:polysaccharide export protein [Candidatus Aminicenantes bacterium]